MGTPMDKFYFKGEQISKQTLDKIIKWGKMLSAITGGCNTREELSQRFGCGTKGRISHLKKAGMIVSVGRGINSYYELQEKGVKLIDDVKQYEKEKRNEKI